MTKQAKGSESSARRSLALSFYTFLSRILGLVRDHFMAVSFGTGMVASAFSVAYRLPNMFRNLLAEGTLSQSFMPIFSEYEKIGILEARVMAGTVLSFLFLCLSLFVALFWFFAAGFLPALVGGSPEYGALVVELSLVLFFLIMTASLSSIFMSISNSHHNYFVPSLSPIILNFSYLIVFIFIFPFYHEIREKVFVLAYGIVTGGVLQLLVQAWYVYKNGYGPIFRLNLKHPAIRKIFKLMLPAALGGSFYQIGLLVDIFLANYIQNQNPGLGAVVSLDYSQRLVQLPTGIIGVALATTILPSLLKDLREGREENVPKEISDVLSFAFFLTLPASIGLAVLGETVLDSIYYGGRWDHLATITAFYPLVFYSFAIPFYSINKVLVSSYYAFSDTKTPLRIQLVSFFLSILVSIGLMFFLKHSAIALASALSASVTSSLLLYYLKAHQVKIPFLTVWFRILKMVPALFGLFLWLVVSEWIIKPFLVTYLSDSFGLGFANVSRLCLVVSILPAVVLYFTVAGITKLPEADIILGRFLRKFRKKAS
ncbi:murein biosynthesis integral membrane protein MurJ [Leptospira bandrabouensis]|uniref:Probable lipid II flippase MurJ n=1 Tax=Leptospira bandrabouensis TaxID=2484903 RepID=A0A6H3NT82_9LEPT|nr:murein biosynthesis integral membrane protein MurJ [Leptospira bandrabouensis]TGN06238.1 murein biosynthesis integral membrane protein MurJ [Leptospira bandrabouensis]TGN16572.1 murein biosynthesis integral membrane protein MurJ [Leptospira bandrabouensis]